MDKEPVQVHFFQTSTLPILEFSLGCKNKEAQAYLIGMAVALIDKAKKYNGIPYQKKPIMEKNNEIPINVLVQSAILFKTQENLQEFILKEGIINSN